MKLREYLKFKWVDDGDGFPHGELLPFVFFFICLFGFASWFTVVSLFYIAREYYYWLFGGI